MTRRTILMYHRVADDPADPYGLCVDPERFEAQLCVLAELADVVALGDLVATARPARRARVRGRPQVALTFDDGYADNLEHALPALEAHFAPATLFVATGALGHPRGFWSDRLALLLAGRAEVELELELAGSPLRVSLHGARAATDTLVALHSRLRLLDTEAIDAALVTIASQLGTVVPEPRSARVLRYEELEKLASSPLVTVGAHTVDHRLLAGLSLAAQEAQMRRSVLELEELLGRPVRDFAYPYGDSSSFDRVSLTAARNCGFATACTTLGGRVTRLNDRLQLPRWMVRDWDADAFRSRLLAWGAV